jgi:hypothetical protein
MFDFSNETGEQPHESPELGLLLSDIFVNHDGGRAADPFTVGLGVTPLLVGHDQGCLGCFSRTSWRLWLKALALHLGGWGQALMGE